MTPLKVINRAIIFAAILAATPLSFPTIIYSQGRGTGTCTEWIDGKWRQVPCRPDPTPNPPPGTERPDRDVYIPPPEDSRLAEAREQNDLGMKAQNKGNWGIAAYHFEQALAKDPNSALYRANLSNARRQIEIEAKRRQQELLRDERKRIESGRDKGGLKPIDSSELFGLRPSNPGSSDLRPLDNRITRDFSGPQGVWKQLNCAVDLMGRALSVATPEHGEPSFNESRSLLDEASNALEARSEGAPCQMGEPLSRVSGRTPDLARAVKKERDLIQRARSAIDELEKARRPLSDEERIAIAHAQSQKNKEAIAQRDAAALEQARTSKRSRASIVVPTPSASPKPEAKLQKVLEKIGDEAEGVLVSFRLKSRRSPPPASNNPK